LGGLFRSVRLAVHIGLVLDDVLVGSKEGLVIGKHAGSHGRNGFRFGSLLNPKALILRNRFARKNDGLTPRRRAVFRTARPVSGALVEFRRGLRFIGPRESRLRQAAFAAPSSAAAPSAPATRFAH